VSEANWRLQKELKRARHSAAASRRARWTAALIEKSPAPNTPPAERADPVVACKTSRRKRSNCQDNSQVSRRHVGAGLRNRLIRQEIIGRTARCPRRGNGPNLPLVPAVPSSYPPFAILHKPSSQHGRGVLLEVRIQQLANLFAEIGGVREPGEFVALKARFRSGEKKIPRRFDFWAGHGKSPEKELRVTISV
jgi:hypothetical protein